MGCQIGSYFKLKERNSRLSTELRAGAVTFLTVSKSEAYSTLFGTLHIQSAARMRGKLLKCENVCLVQ